MFARPCKWGITLPSHVALCSMLFDKDAGHKVFMDDVYENESRLPGGIWKPARIPWTDVVYIRTGSSLDYSRKVARSNAQILRSTALDLRLDAGCSLLLKLFSLFFDTSANAKRLSKLISCL